VPAHCAVNLALSKKLTDNFKVFGYVNNLLNNPYYVLYYYKEPGLNLGLGAKADF